MGKTYDLLRQAEENVQRRFGRNKQLIDFEHYLRTIGLSEDQISDQNQYKIRQSLILLNRYIANPGLLLKRIIDECDTSDIVFDLDIKAILIDRKKFALLRYDALINIEKYDTIKQVAKEIDDKNIRSTIENSLHQLAIKDQIFKKEYWKLDQISNQSENRYFLHYS